MKTGPGIGSLSHDCANMLIVPRLLRNIQQVLPSPPPASRPELTARNLPWDVVADEFNVGHVGFKEYEGHSGSWRGLG